jgi:hypothetical protein
VICLTRVFENESSRREPAEAICREAMFRWNANDVAERMLADMGAPSLLTALVGAHDGRVDH